MSTCLAHKTLQLHGHVDHRIHLDQVHVQDQRSVDGHLENHDHLQIYVHKNLQFHGHDDH